MCGIIGIVGNQAVAERLVDGLRRMEYRGYAPQWGQVVVRGDLAKREFLAFWLADGRVVVAMNANLWDYGDDLTELVESERRVDPNRLTDPDVPLAEAA